LRSRLEKEERERERVGNFKPAKLGNLKPPLTFTALSSSAKAKAKPLA